jgi:hypothetical protein
MMCNGDRDQGNEGLRDSDIQMALKEAIGKLGTTLR